MVATAAAAAAARAAAAKELAAAASPRPSPRGARRTSGDQEKNGTGDACETTTDMDAVAAELSQFSRPKTTPSRRAMLQHEDVIVARYCPSFWMYQDQARAFYKDTRTEVAVAALIGGNFLTNLVQATIDPQNADYEDVFDSIDIFFTFAFTVELIVNMYGFWCCPFWNSAWNIFDFFVVAIALLTSIKVPLPGPFTLLRMLRVFRVFRLFKRVKSLKKIMDSLANAIPGVINAFIILLLVMCIYSILAVEFFSTVGLGGRIENELGITLNYTTPREQDYGMEYFGNFPKAMYTMFQVLTGESWSEAVVRPLLHSPDTAKNLGTALYFVSFVLICGIILINVVVAVLLEKMVDNEVIEQLREWQDSEDEREEDDENTTVAPDPQGGKPIVALHGRQMLEQEVGHMKKDLDQVKQQMGQILQIVQDLHAGATHGRASTLLAPGAINGHGSNGCVSIEPPKAPHPHSLWDEPTGAISGPPARLPGTIHIE
eukprot:TRINITY_DN6517_c0_g1_i1.p1 TRINITY_DN6517_c0_g1~~TRINITY_DN6517_c0_g1_i1.p1  ORF type:complete len:488 (-),score=95.77 TRINITY_DN6517_c0_g1_i1:60-1523(-)